MRGAIVYHGECCEVHALPTENDLDQIAELCGDIPHVRRDIEFARILCCVARIEGMQKIAGVLLHRLLRVERGFARASQIERIAIAEGVSPQVADDLLVAWSEGCERMEIAGVASPAMLQIWKDENLL